MDPYLEKYWGDVHTSLMVYARNQINPQLPDDLQARVEESVSVTAQDDTSRTLYPDIRVVEDDEHSAAGGGTATSLVTVAQPCVVIIEDEPRTERHLEIVDVSDGGRVVTAIEFLSPANKVGIDGRLAYRRKQREFLEAGVNLVEIDLVREGDHVLAVPAERIPLAYRTPYSVCVRRAKHPGRVEIYRAPLREPLPNIPIPLRATDRDIVLQLQPLIAACYRDGSYRRINYRNEPAPRLGEDDAAWADELLRGRGLR